MHVLVVTVVHHPEDARIQHRQIAALLAAGHRVTFAAPFTARGVCPRLGVSAIDLPRALGRRRVAALRAARDVVASRSADVDLLLLHDPELVLAVAGLRRRPVTVWDVHEDTPASMSLKPWMPGPLRPVAAAGVRWLEGFADRHLRLLLAEDSYADRFSTAHPIVPNTAGVPEVTPPPGSRRVVYLGNVTAARGVHDMVETARLLGGRADVEIIGGAEPTIAAVLRAAVAENLLTWHGFVPNDRALHLLDGAVAGLSLLHDHANYRQSRPTKVIEYMSRGIPVITTPVPGARELVEKYDAGLVVPFSRPDLVAAAVRTLQDDADLRRRLGGNGHAAAQEHLHWTEDAARFVRLLEDWSCGSQR